MVPPGQSILSVGHIHLLLGSNLKLSSSGPFFPFGILIVLILTVACSLPEGELCHTAAVWGTVVWLSHYGTAEYSSISSACE